MPILRHLDARCHKCGTVNAVGEKYWPATRYDPADGELEREECEECGEPFGDETAWSVAEPPDPY